MLFLGLALRSTAGSVGFAGQRLAVVQVRLLSTTQQCFDHYKTLGVSRTTSSADIKKAYFELSKKFHPDLHAQASTAQQAKATAKFADINSAYAVLSDARLKAEYDMNLLGPAAFAARAQSMRSVYDNPSYGFYKGPTGGQSPYKVVSDTSIIMAAVGLMVVSLIVHWFRFHSVKEDLTMLLDERNAIASANLEQARQRGYERGVDGQLQRLRDMHAAGRAAEQAAAAAASAVVVGTAST
eukprot:m.229045 g.229045  ORF g.229045 m.229045 type:complete len:240 (+) comp17650_c0_seq1:416-1135(+)